MIPDHISANINWIHGSEDLRVLGIANQIVGEGYIPYSPFGGLHRMDDYGDLVRTLPGGFHSQQSVRDYYYILYGSAHE